MSSLDNPEILNLTSTALYSLTVDVLYEGNLITDSGIFVRVLDTIGNQLNIGQTKNGTITFTNSELEDRLIPGKTIRIEAYDQNGSYTNVTLSQIAFTNGSRQ